MNILNKRSPKFKLDASGRRAVNHKTDHAPQSGEHSKTDTQRDTEKEKTVPDNRDHLGDPAANSKLTDDEVIEMASAARNASRFQSLWLGDITGCKSREEATLRLLCILAYWTDRDAEQMDRLFRLSGFMGPKWESKVGDSTYGKRNIQLAIRKTRVTYPEQRAQSANTSEQARQRTEDLLLYANRTTAAEYAFEAAPFLAQLSASEVGPLKARFKKALGDALNLNDLNKAINEAARKANKSERAREQLRTGYPSVMTSNRPLRDTSDEALCALYDANNPLSTFVRGNSLVRVVLDEKNTPIIQDLTHSHVRGLLTRAANFFAQGDQKWVHISPPDTIVQDVLTRGSWKFPPLEAIVQCPVLRCDGSILSQPGYDPATRLIYLPQQDLRLPSIPKHPTREDVERSKAIIEEILTDFPFADAASKANTYALLLTPLIRHAVRGNVPMALISAPQQGTGKSLLAEVVSMIATGRPAAMMTECRDEEEWGKALTSVLLEGTTVNIIDNVENPLKSAKLAALLTAPVFKHRILGRNVELALANRATWIATGNGLRVGGDMARRCYFIRLDAGMSRPFERENFKHSDLIDWISRNHGKVLAALLIIAVEWFQAGKPKAKVKMIGGFTDWTSTLGGILERQGIEGFLENRHELYDQADEEESEWQMLFEALFAHYPEQAFSISDVYKALVEIPDLRAALPNGLSEDLEMSELNNTPSGFAKALGKAFAKRENRRYGELGLHLERAGNQGHAILWRFVVDRPA